LLGQDTMSKAPRCFASLLACALALFPALASADDPPQATTQPAGPSPSARRNVPMAVAGGALMGTGFATLVAGYFVMDNNKVCTQWSSPGGWLSGFKSCEATAPRDLGVQDAAFGMMIGGGMTLVVGIPLLIVGLRKEPVPPPVAALLGKPAPGGWAWSF
jgi:hypothetical protein